MEEIEDAGLFNLLPGNMRQAIVDAMEVAYGTLDKGE
jgi:hypothetical protein